LSCCEAAFDGNCIFLTCRRPDFEPGIWSRNRRRVMGPPQLLLVVATKPRSLTPKNGVRPPGLGQAWQGQKDRGGPGGKASLPGLSGLPQPGLGFAWRMGSMLSASSSWASLPQPMALGCGNDANEPKSEGMGFARWASPRQSQASPSPGRGRPGKASRTLQGLAGERLADRPA
jgi:hypothetical protein